MAMKSLPIEANPNGMLAQLPIPTREPVRPERPLGRKALAVAPLSVV